MPDVKHPGDWKSRGKYAMTRKLIPFAILVALLTVVTQGRSFDLYTLTHRAESINTPSSDLGQASSQQPEQKERRHPAPSPGGHDMSGIIVHRIRSAPASAFSGNKPGVELDLYNPNGH